MKNEKKNENAKMKKVPAQRWNEIPPWSGHEVPDGLTSVPRGTMRRYIVLARQLEAQAPKVLTPGEQRMLGRMVGARETADAALDHWRTEKADIKGPWSDVVSLMASVTTTLAGHARTKVEEVAQRAQEVTLKVFVEGVVIGKLTPQEAWLEVNKVRTGLEEDEDLFGALTEFVPAAVMEALFEANGRLGQALHITARGDDADVVDKTAVQAYLRRRMTAYVRCIAAAADDEDLGSVQRALTALQPIAAFRASNAKRTVRSADADEAEDEDEDEATGTPVSPSAPVATAPPVTAAPPVVPPTAGGDTP